ncbi:MAG: hypothetical protein KBC98_00620 [Candidatus Pacebacteria bacterium]|nr:hypothetical protein [Candidatus Paceibacterota bacterium]
MTLGILKVFLPSVIAFTIGILSTPLFTHFFYKYRLWKRVSRNENSDAMSPAFQKLHNVQHEVKTPRVGGIIIWFSVVLTIGILAIIDSVTNAPITERLNFISRNQTLIPFAALIIGSIIGLFEDFLEIFAARSSLFAQGLSSKYLVCIVLFVGFLAALWFYQKLGISQVYVPFVGYLEFGIGFIPFFMLVVFGTFSSRVIDGIDGLAGGVMAIAFAAYSVIALVQNQFDIAAFSLVVTGGILAFLWFNIPPARFYMGETGMLGLTLTLALIAFLTDGVFLLLIIGIMLVITSLSSTIQIVSKKYFKKKIFLVAPIHHHFQALGWSREKITMRYWIISIMMAVLGIVIAIIG